MENSEIIIFYVITRLLLQEENSPVKPLELMNTEVASDKTQLDTDSETCDSSEKGSVHKCDAQNHGFVKDSNRRLGRSGFDEQRRGIVNCRKVGPVEGTNNVEGASESNTVEGTNKQVCDTQENQNCDTNCGSVNICESNVNVGKINDIIGKGNNNVVKSNDDSGKGNNNVVKSNDDLGKGNVVKSNDDSGKGNVVKTNDDSGKGNVVKSNDDSDKSNVMKSNDDSGKGNVVKSNDDSGKGNVVKSNDDSGKGNVGESDSDTCLKCGLARKYGCENKTGQTDDLPAIGVPENVKDDTVKGLETADSEVTNSSFNKITETQRTCEHVYRRQEGVNVRATNRKQDPSGGGEGDLGAAARNESKMEIDDEDIQCETKDSCDTSTVVKSVGTEKEDVKVKNLTQLQISIGTTVMVKKTLHVNVTDNRQVYAIHQAENSPIKEEDLFPKDLTSIREKVKDRNYTSVVSILHSAIKTTHGTDPKWS